MANARSDYVKKGNKRNFLLTSPTTVRLANLIKLLTKKTKSLWTY